MRGIKRKLHEAEGKVQELEGELKKLKSKQSRDFSEFNSRDQGPLDPVIKTRRNSHKNTNDLKTS